MLIALDVAQAFKEEGANVIMATTLDDAMRGVEDPLLCAAVLDHGLRDEDSSLVYARMKERNLPFVVYSGYSHIEGAVVAAAVHVRKPGNIPKLVAAVKSLVAGHSRQH